MGREDHIVSGKFIKWLESESVPMFDPNEMHTSAHIWNYVYFRTAAWGVFSELNEALDPVPIEIRAILRAIG